MFRSFNKYCSQKKLVFFERVKNLSYSCFLNGRFSIVFIVSFVFFLPRNNRVALKAFFYQVQAKLKGVGGGKEEFNLDGANINFIKLVYFLYISFGFFCEALIVRKKHLETSHSLKKAPKRLFIEDALITGRGVAVVCPGDNGGVFGKEIDGFDTVFRIGNQSSLVKLHSEKIGRRCDAVAINKEHLGNLVNNGLLEEGVRYYIKPSAQSLARFENKQVFSKLHLPIAGHPNLLQLAINHLLQCSPSSIKIFNANLFLSDKKYFDGYDKSRLDNFKQDLMTCRMLASHDPFSNFIYLSEISRLYSKVISLDPVLEGLLNLSLEGYAKKLSERYCFASC